MKATDTAPGKRKQKAKMNLPNRLTVLRLIMVPVFIAVMVLPDSVVPALVTGIIGAFLFITAAMTDMLDGKIARKYGLITDFGKLMDPLADKFMVIGALTVIVYRYDTLRPVFIWALLVVVFRELAVTSLAWWRPHPAAWLFPPICSAKSRRSRRLSASVPPSSSRCCMRYRSCAISCRDGGQRTFR